MTRNAGDSAVDTQRSSFRRLAGFFRAFLDRRRIAALLELSEHELSDMGLSSHDVRQVLKLPLSMDPSEALREMARRRGIEL